MYTSILKNLHLGKETLKTRMFAAVSIEQANCNAHAKIDNFWAGQKLPLTPIPFI